MREFFETLAISCVPAIITGVITYLTSSHKAKTEITSLKESNKHEIEKLMKQHEVDLDALQEQHKLEAEKSEQEHKHKIEIMELEHKNQIESKEKEQSDAAMLGFITNIMGDPQKIKGLLELADNPKLKN